MTAAFRLSISGRVQGVGFRAFVSRHARQRGLRGWARNRSDGSVEALLIGDHVAVAAVIDECERGPAPSRVDRLDKTASDDDGSPGFIERPTV